MTTPQPKSGSTDPEVLLQDHIRRTTGNLVGADQLKGLYVGVVQSVNQATMQASVTIPFYSPTTVFVASYPPCVVQGTGPDPDLVLWPGPGSSGKGTLCLVAFINLPIPNDANNTGWQTSPQQLPIIVALYPGATASLIPHSATITPTPTTTNGSAQIKFS